MATPALARAAMPRERLRPARRPVDRARATLWRARAMDDASTPSRELERVAMETLGRGPKGARALGGRDAKAWLRAVIADVATWAVERATAADVEGFDLTREIVRASGTRGAAPTAEAAVARAHRETTAPLFRDAALGLLKAAFDGDEAKARRSEGFARAWAMSENGEVRKTPNGSRRVTEDDAEGDSRNAALRARVARHVDVGQELLDVERACELASSSSMDEFNGEASDFDEESLAERETRASGLRLVGATRGGDGRALLVLRATDGKDIPVNALTVGDRVTISAVGFVSGSYDADEATQERLGDIAPAQATVRFMGDALGKDAIGRYGDAGSITLEYEGDERALATSLSGLEVCLSRAPDETTYERQRRALNILASIPAVKRSKPACARIVRTIFHENRPTLWRDARGFDGGDGVHVEAVAAESLSRVERRSVTGVTFDNSQILALRAASTKKYPVVCVQGPPGTGKTAVVIEMIAQACARGERVLACAPSNLAVDNLVERLDGIDAVRAVRFGAPERISAAALSCSIDAKVAEATEAYFQKQRVDSSETSATLRELMERYQKATNVPSAVKEKLQGEIEATKRKLKSIVGGGTKHRKAAQTKIVREANVVLTTNAGAGLDALQTLPPFDLVVIDEAAQASEPLSWIPLVRGKRAILIGDPCQLAPVILSREAIEAGLARSLMSRLMPSAETLPLRDDESSARASDGILTLTLSTQYRSHEAISSWSSKEAYAGRLRAADSVRGALLQDLPGVQDTVLTRTPMLMITTRSPQGRIPSEYSERRVGGSYINEGEAKTAMAHVKMLLKAGVRAKDIVVISPYAAQVRLLRSMIAETLEDFADDRVVDVSSVDSFQGREAECVIISTVRSNGAGRVGFLSDSRRMNVAVTRGKRQVAIIGDDQTIKSDDFLRRLVDHIESAGLFIPQAELFSQKEAEVVAERAA